MFLKMHQQQEEDQGELPALIGEKVEALNAFFTSLFISKTWFFGYPPSKLEDRNRNLDEAPIIQEEMVTSS